MSFDALNLIKIEDLTNDEIGEIFKTAKKIKPDNSLSEKLISLIFLEDSTRTRVSFEIAAKRLGASTTFFQTSGSSLSKGESFEDTLHVLEAMGPDLFVIRTDDIKVLEDLKNRISLPIINAGAGTKAHPTQALLDAFTIREIKGSLEGLNIGILGDVRHSRVAASNRELLTRFGVHLHFIGPIEWLPENLQEKEISFHTNLDEVLPSLDVLMTLRVQKERQEAISSEKYNQFALMYGVNREVLSRGKKDLHLMHPGPVNWGVELDESVRNWPRSLILKQVENGVRVRMALLKLFLNR